MTAQLTRAPGFTAARTIRRGIATGMTRASDASPSAEAGSIVLQNCPEGVLAVCGPLLQTCFYGWCWSSRVFGGPGACSGCMSICLDLHGWFGASGLCKPCAMPGGTGTNICA